MRKIIVALFILTLMAAVTRAEDHWIRAKDYHLVQTQMLDSDVTNGRPLTVYVLTMPDDTRPQVFKTFGSKEMEARFGSLGAGSVVYYDANGFLPRVQSGEFEKLKAACEEKGVRFDADPRAP